MTLHAGQAADGPLDLEKFYRAEYPRVVRFLILRGARPADAADAAQYAFVEACIRWNRLRRLEKPDSYVRRAAVNEWMRQSRRRETDVDRAVRAGWYDPIAIDLVAWADDVKPVLDSLAMLPDRQREVIAWIYDGFTVAEIANSLDMAPSTVRSTIRHAKEKLRTLLTGQMEDSGNE